MRLKILLGALAAGYVVAAAACGARSELPIPNPRPERESEGGGPPDCAVFNSSTELAPLDVFVMLDRSGSMQLPTGEGIGKWYAVRDALDAFFYDPESRGIRVGLSFFPIIDELVPELCDEDAECHAATPSPCKPFMVCPTTMNQCEDDADCDLEGNGDTCEPLGRCSMQQVAFCVPGFLECTSTQGTCVPVGYCENRFTCEAAAYEPPFVELGLLPDHGFNLLNGFNQIGPEGGTPTLPALTGVVNHAAAWAADNPESNVIVVLATDGVPTVCDPAIDMMDDMQAVQNLADAAAAGAEQGIQTFVIGVFAPEEEEAAQPSLSAIAEAGGTGVPFIVNTAGEVTSEFREALNQVRLSAKACEFDLVPSDEPVDYTEVWVRLRRGGEEEWVPRVDSLEDCDPQQGGFFFDVPVPGPTEPTSVRLCPATCELLGSSPDRTVDIFTTCGPGDVSDV
jgi:hypothetical protein